MGSVRQIPAGELVKDLQSGMTAAQVMAKYSLSAEELRRLLKQLEKAGANLSKLYGRTVEDSTSEVIKRIRFLPRYKVVLPVPIHDADDPRITGILLDISEKGLGTEGIDADPGQIRRFLVMADQFFPIDPFRLEATCRWIKATGDEKRFIAGFEITAIADRAFQDLRSFVKSLGRAQEAKQNVAESGLYALRSAYGEHVSTIWICPFCKMPQPREYDECPQCGIIASKYHRQKSRTRTEVLHLINEAMVAPGKAASLIEKTEGVARTVRIPARLWQQLEALGGSVDQHVTKAVSSYLLKGGSDRTVK